MHSVTFSPVNSKCTPPRSTRWPLQVERLLELDEDVFESAGLEPRLGLCVLPCIGSHTHSTVFPVRRTASISGGSRLAICHAPKRWISVSRPGSLSGLQTIDQPLHNPPASFRPDLHRHRIADAAEDTRRARRPDPPCACRSTGSASTGCTSLRAAAPCRVCACS